MRLEPAWEHSIFPSAAPWIVILCTLIVARLLARSTLSRGYLLRANRGDYCHHGPPECDEFQHKSRCRARCSRHALSPPRGSRPGAWSFRAVSIAISSSSPRIAARWTTSSSVSGSPDSSIDQIRVLVALEPGSLALFAAGLGLIAIRRFRRR